MSSKWDCSLCEYSNQGNNAKCEMCDTPHSSSQPLRESKVISQDNEYHNVQQQQQHTFVNVAQNNYDDPRYLTFTNFNNFDQENVNENKNKNWICEQCDESNIFTNLFCAVCGFNKGYEPVTDRNNKHKHEHEHKHEQNTENKQQYQVIFDDDDDDDQKNIFFEDGKQEEKYANDFMSMAAYRQQEPLHNYKIDINSYNIGDQVLYPKSYREFENKLSEYKTYQSPKQNPSKYSLGCVLAVDAMNYVVSITDILLNNNASICMHIALIHKFNSYEYNSFRRGTSISFYDESEHVQDWREGRIESIFDRNVAIQFNNDSWTMVPIFYIKQYQELKEDEWSGVSDFVFKEYVRDVATELAKKAVIKSGHSDIAVIDPNEFRAAMERLGIKSLTSRTKAFEIFEQLKSEIIISQQRQEENMAQTLQLLMSEGHVVGEYKCCGQCKAVKKDGEGIYLSNCKHIICKHDFGQLLDAVLQSGTDTLLQCPVASCRKAINPIDTERHGTLYQHSLLTQMQLDLIQYNFEAAEAVCFVCGGKNDIMDGLVQYVCMFCGSDNCLQCKCMHSNEMSCAEFQNANHTHAFRAQWRHNHETDARQGAVLTDVAKNSNEWNEIVSEMKYSPEKVLKISRIEHKELWNKYWTYSKSLQDSKVLKEVRVWHGTRATNPSLIYSNGFLKEKSRVGGCLWYAVNSSYSMSGFQHPMGNGQSQLFLCFVAGGNGADVKYIRSNKILNVYKNEATYPAYLITYK